MKYSKWCSFLLLLLILFGTTFSSSQSKDYGFKFGLQFSGLLPATEFWESQGLKTSYLARGFGRYGVIDDLRMELGFGYGSFAGLDFDRDYYRTQLVPFDLLFLYNFMQSDSWSPYLYFGTGVLYYHVTNLPASVSHKSVKDHGYTSVYPVGLGTEINLADKIDLDLSIGANYSLTDNLNYFREGNPMDAYYTAGVGILFDISTDGDDPDHDGLTNKEEKELGTDPNNPDTDGDGLNDGDEVHTYRTNALKTDTDGDGLKDGEEVLQYKTDPLKADTDGDGLNDGLEVTKHKTDPIKADTDGDGLDDGDEVFKYKTDPLNMDTDGDGLKDGEEVLKYKTNPLKADTDDDGLSDGDEVMKYKTDPLKADTDGGTVYDGKEIANGTNPLDPSDDVPKAKEVLKVEVGKSITLEGIVFKTGSAEINPVSEEILTKAFNTLEQNPEIEVEIQGHTDNVGKHTMNMKLSQRRADAVKAYLVKNRIAESRISTKGYGSDKPIAPNTTAEGKQKNRRIEFFRSK